MGNQEPKQEAKPKPRPGIVWVRLDPRVGEDRLNSTDHNPLVLNQHGIMRQVVDGNEVEDMVLYPWRAVLAVWYRAKV